MQTQISQVTDKAVRSGAPVAPVRQSRYVRRRMAAIGLLATLIFGFGVVIGGAGATAEIVEPVAGYEVVAAGETLWDVAVRTAPDGVDPRQHLATLRELNGLGSSAVVAWTVVAIPAQ